MTDPWQRFNEAVADAAVTMPDGHLRILASRIAAHSTPATAWGITKEPPVREYTAAASRIIGAWTGLPDGVSGVTVAAAIGAAAATRTAMREHESVSLVWTGPDTQHIRAQRTSDVVLAVIAQARRDLLLVSFASTRVDRIRDALTDAAGRGVNISLLLETAEAAEGQYQGPAVDPFEGIQAARYVWATEHRPRVGGRPAVLHAKIVLADDRVAFISSANLTGRALDRNIEAGVVVTGGPIPKALFSHFKEMAYGGVVEMVG